MTNSYDQVFDLTNCYIYYIPNRVGHFRRTSNLRPDMSQQWVIKGGFVQDFDFS